MRTCFVCILLIGSIMTAWSQQKSPEEYKQDKERRLKEKSPFEKIIDREQYATIVYENEHVIAFSNIKDQAPVHYLIVPKKRIATVNDITENDVVALGHLFLAAKELAQKFGIAESGFRLAVNTNQDAGQSVFHLHMHLLGGHNLGAMVTTDFAITKPVINLSPATIEPFIGRYQLPYIDEAKASVFVLNVTKDGGKLYTQLPGQPKSEMFAQTETRFFSRAVNSEVEFLRNDAGQVDEIILYQGGQSFKGKRIKRN